MPDYEKPAISQVMNRVACDKPLDQPSQGAFALPAVILVNVITWGVAVHEATVLKVPVSGPAPAGPNPGGPDPGGPDPGGPDPGGPDPGRGRLLRVVALPPLAPGPSLAHDAPLLRVIGQSE